MQSQIYADTDDEEIDIPEQCKPYLEDLTEGLLEFKIKSSIRNLYKQRNFQHQWISGPKGYTATFNASDHFKIWAFINRWFSAYAAVRIRLNRSEFTVEKQKKIEDVTRRIFPTTTSRAPYTGETNEGGFGPSMGEFGNFIGIYSATIKKEEKDELKEYFYLISHTSLPEEYYDELQDYCWNVQNAVTEFEYNKGVVSKETLAKAPVCSFRDMFISSDAMFKKAKEVAEDNIKRLMYEWSQETDIPLDVDMINKSECFYDRPLGEECPNRNYLEEALSYWPKSADGIQKSTLFPYSRIPEDDEKAPKHLRGYNIGHCLYLQELKNKEVFENLLKTHGCAWEREVPHFSTDCITLYNCFSTERNTLITWHNHCTELKKAPVLVFNGLQKGFDLYNYNPETRQPIKTLKNNFSNSAPVMFPFKEEVRNIPVETVYKFYSRTKGGYEKSYLIPDQFQGQYKTPPVSTMEAILGTNEKISLVPEQLFLAPYTKPFILNFQN